MIYCVVPRALEDELFDRLTAYYAGDENVTVIVDRRVAGRRTPGSTGGGARKIRDRRKRPYTYRQPAGDAASGDALGAAPAAD